MPFRKRSTDEGVRIPAEQGTTTDEQTALDSNAGEA
ncbi:hypothetical protein ZOD2009_06349 [Haladaptatus paucihalophilus DX253]|uniref:Uncharacterized protein n=1 Tax=Haladaptatus paucihalophilus DX253 TaxID=797209 RepID=E7QR47_HALPU|nr:hypothetical protein ZOD2009_06349 [Haladaptatus paucihalophilus DX253]